MYKRATGPGLHYSKTKARFCTHTKVKMFLLEGVSALYYSQGMTAVVLTKGDVSCEHTHTHTQLFVIFLQIQ